MLRALEVSPMDCLIYIKDHQELYSKKIKEILASFITETTEDLFNTRDEAIAGLLARDPRDRLTVQEFLNTPFMKDYAAANGSEHVEGANIANDPRNYATEAELISRLSLNERENHDLTKDDIKTLINQADNENPFDDSDDEDEMLNIAIQESIQAQQRQRRGPPQPMRAAAPPPQPAGIAHDMGNYLPDDIDISQLL